MDLISTKILVAVLFGVLRFFFGILPFKIYKCLLRWEGEESGHQFVNKKRHLQVTCCLALCQSFGGGVLFATAFLHMMPDVYYSVEALKRNGGLQTNFPLSQLTISCGFFLVYFVEEFSHWFITKLPECEQQHKQQKNNNLGTRVITPIVNKVSPVKEKHEQVFIIEKEKKSIAEKSLEDNQIVTNGWVQNEKVEYDTESLSSNVLEENEHNLELDEEIEQDETQQKMEKEAKTRQQIVRYILIVVALSLHAIFEGLAIGLQNSIANIWYLFIAVSIHSATILFYISMELLLVKAKRKTIIIHILTLSLTSPLGVLLGLLITLRANMNTKAKSAAVILLEGLSAGTILYITFFEVLNREKARRIYRLRRSLCILAGFALMAALQSIEIHEEED